MIIKYLAKRINFLIDNIPKNMLNFTNKKKIGGQIMSTEITQKISLESQERLLKIARDSIESHLKKKPQEEFEISDPMLREKRGAFVTLHKHDDLRGCIGDIIGSKPLHETVAEMAVAAAVRDPRFSPLTIDELSEVDIEISAMTPLKKIDNIDEIKVGTHGLYIKRGFLSGLLLPQVATEYGWNKEEFLEYTCQKAHLPMDAWKDEKTEIYIFSAQVFGEKE